MRTFHSAILIATLPAGLLAQWRLPDSFQLVPPSISVRVEKYRDIDNANLRMINNLTVDHAGFLWCATSEGLIRFDGYEATLYRDEQADTLGRSNTAFGSVAVDGNGFVWGGSPNGLRRLDPATGKSRWYMVSPKDTTSVGSGSIVLLVTSEGDLWAGGLRGIALYNCRSDAFRLFPYPPQYHTEGVFLSTSTDPISLCESARTIWVGSQLAGVAGFNRDNHTWKVYRHSSADGAGPSSDNVWAVSGDRAGALWVGSLAGLERYDPVTNIWRRPGTWRDGNTRIPEIRVHGVVEDDYGGLWIATGGAGLFRLDPASGRLLQFLHNPDDPAALPYNMVWRASTSRGGGRLQTSQMMSPPAVSVVWIPHGLQGVSRAIVREDVCTRILIAHSKAMIPPTARALLREPSGKMWVGIFNDSGPIGLFDLERRTCRWYSGPEGIARVGRLCDGSIILTTRTARVWMLDAKRDAFFPVAPGLNALSFLEGKDSCVWLGCHKDGKTFLASLDRRTGTCTFYPREDSSSRSYRENAVTRMCTDNSGILWYGTSGGGLMRFDPLGKTYHRYTSCLGSPEALVNNFVTTLVPDSGKLWVGTQAGLDLFDCERGTFEHMRSPNPAHELHIQEMVDDGEGHLWLVSQPTVACFTKASRAFRWLPIPDEYEAVPIPWGVALDSPSRMISVAMAGGFFMFSLDNPPASSHPPPVVLTSFRVFEKPYPLDGDIWSLNSITLPHSASFFSFTFAALDFLKSTTNQYSYRLEGFDPDWVHSGSRRYVSYSNLDAGSYVFRVRGTNSEGTWSDKGAAIEIIVLPPWYRTIWAYGAYALLAGGLLFVLRRFDRRRAALKHSLEMKSFEAEKMREVDQMKSSFFANISHEFRTPLTLILGPIDQLASRFQQPDVQATLSTMRRNGMRLLDLINQILDISRLDSGRVSVKVQPLDLIAHFQPLVMSFVSLAERKKINLIFDPKEKEIVSYVDRDKVDKILTNLLSNAFKFTGEGGEIRVVLRTINGDAEDTVDMGARPGMGPRGSKVEIAVSDTGIGIEAKDMGRIFDRFYQVESAHAQGEGGTGIGLALTKELVDLHKGEITVKSEPGRGSTFTVRLPLGKDHWRPEDILTEELVPIPAEAHPFPATPADEEGADGEPPQDPGKPVVLIVEDNADVRTYVRGFLQKNYTIEEAENGQSALEKARSVRVDLVLSDIMMPVMDGVQLCRELKGDDRTNHIPVILLTARATEEGKMEGLDIGADDYIVKPFEARELVARVKNLVEIRKTLRDKYRRNVTLGPAEIDVASADERFLKQLTETIEKHITDVTYDTEKLSHDMCMSRMQLNRKLQALTGHSTHELVRQYRLQRAAQLLRKHAGNISEVAFESGFSSLSHFARAFREQFGMLPSEYEASVPENATRAKTREP